MPHHIYYFHLLWPNTFVVHESASPAYTKLPFHLPGADIFPDLTPQNKIPDKHTY